MFMRDEEAILRVLVTNGDFFVISCYGGGVWFNPL